MKITIMRENINESEQLVPIVYETDAEDWELTIAIDYEERKKVAVEGENVERRTPQEIMDDEINKPLQSNWRSENRVENRTRIPMEDFDKFEDVSDELCRQKSYERESVCQLVRTALKKKSDWADMVIAICIDGVSTNDYAAKVGQDASNISHKMARAKEKLKKFFINRQIR